MTYEDISRVNGEIKMLDMKGKEYAMVPERVTAFRKLYPQGYISTDIISNDGTTVLMKATVGYYDTDGTPVVLGSGFAQEIRGKGMVNGTSHIENCETSAVGRALGFLGLGINGGGICSAEELANAVTAQNQMKAEQRKKEERPLELQPVEPATLPQAAQGGAMVSTASAVPPMHETTVPEMVVISDDDNSVRSYLAKAIAGMREMRGITAAENMKIFKEQHKTLIAAKMVPDKKLEEYTMEEAMKLVDLMAKSNRRAG